MVSALLPIIEEIREDDVAVVELSSFQLLSMRQSPDVAVITNIAPNHLDVHGTMEEYIPMPKSNLIAHQDAFSRTSEIWTTTHYASGINGSRHADYVFPQNQTGIRHLSAGRWYAVLYQRRQGHTGCPHE